MDLAAITGAAFSLTVVLVALALAGWRAVRSLAWEGRLPRRAGALPIEDVDSVDAPRGWKCARIVASTDGSSMLLRGIAMGRPYAVEDDARCAYGRQHNVPTLRCECGFYSFIEHDEAAGLLTRRAGFDAQVVVQALCEVELSGIVIEHDRGYRAQRQQVLQVGVLPWCASCAAAGRLEVAEVLGGDLRGTPRWLSGPGMQRVARHPASIPRRSQTTEWPGLDPLCFTCAGSLRRPRLVASLADAAGMLGTEVVWLPPDVVPAERILAAHQ